MGFGKVIVSLGVSLVNVTLVETIGYNLLYVHQLATMGFATLFDVAIVVLIWSKTLKVVFIGYAENGLYVVDFLEKITMVAVYLIAKVELE
jgi:hypothetical protein